MKAIIFLIAFLFCAYFVSPVFAEEIFINEFVAHPSTGNPEWVEFYNPNNVDMSAYWLDDDTDFSNDAGSSQKKSLTDIVGINPYPYIEFNSFLNNSEDYVVLFSGDGTIIDQYQYTEDPGIDISLGRYPDGQGSIVILSSATKGSANSEVPTSTPAPSPTSSPTPTFTKTPTPTSAPTPTKTPIPTQASHTPTPKLSISPTSKILPTDVLGKSTEVDLSISPTESETASDNVLVASESKKSSNLFQKILIFLGVVFIASCVIVTFYKVRKENMLKNE